VSDKIGMNDDVEASAKTATRNELLCFMQQNAGVLAFYHFVKLCVYFYRKEEIIAARSMMEQFTARRLSKRQGGDAMKATLEDIAKLLLDPDVKVPTFYAVDLRRLPPVSADHCDVSAILKELHALRQEVHRVAQLRDEVKSLKQEVVLLQSGGWPALSDENDMSRQSERAGGADGVAALEPSKNYVELAKNLKTEGMVAQKQPVVGKSTKFAHVKAVTTKRDVNIFVSRWNPNTTSSEVSECVKDIICEETVENIEITRLKAKYEYASFFVVVTIPASNMRKAIELLMSENSCLLVKRYFVKKDGTEQSNDDK